MYNYVIDFVSIVCREYVNVIVIPRITLLLPVICKSAERPTPQVLYHLADDGE